MALEVGPYTVFKPSKNLLKLCSSKYCSSSAALCCHYLLFPRCLRRSCLAVEVFSRSQLVNVSFFCFRRLVFSALLFSNQSWCFRSLCPSVNFAKALIMDLWSYTRLSLHHFQLVGCRPSGFLRGLPWRVRVGAAVSRHPTSSWYQLSGVFVRLHWERRVWFLAAGDGAVNSLHCPCDTYGCYGGWLSQSQSGTSSVLNEGASRSSWTGCW